MPTIDITRPELIWPGKYDENGNRVENRGTALPFQVIETIREGRATREPGRMSDLFSFSAKQDESHWHNKLMRSSLTNRVEKKAKLTGRFAELYPNVREYVRKRCFGGTVELDDVGLRRVSRESGETWRYLKVRQTVFDDFIRRGDYRRFEALVNWKCKTNGLFDGDGNDR